MPFFYILYRLWLICDNLADPFVVGHRGAAGYEPENTIKSLKKGIELDADNIEIDVRKTKDDNLVVIHDDKVDRTTDGTGKVRDMTLEEIKRLNTGKGEKIPRLGEVLDLLKDEKPITIEIKEPDTAKNIMKKVSSKNMTDETTLVSFFHDAVKYVKKEYPDIRTGVIFSCRPISPLKLASEAEADILLPNHLYVTPKLVDKAHENSFLVSTWTVNSIESAEKLIDMGVDGIASDFPDIPLEAAKNTDKS